MRNLLSILVIFIAAVSACCQSGNQGDPKHGDPSMKKTEVLNSDEFRYSDAKYPSGKGELIPGNFTAMSENAFPAGWQTKYNMSQIFSKKRADGTTVLTFINNGSGPDWRTITYTIDLKSSWRKLLLKGKVTVSDLKQGTEAWNVPCVMPSYSDAAGKNIINYEGVMWKKNGTYEFKREMTIPEGAVKLKLTAGFTGGNGIAEFENISLTVLEESTFSEAFKTAESLKPPLLSASETREEMQLNGVWKFKPEYKDRKTSYGYIRVPGLWAATHRWMIPLFDKVPDPESGAGWKASDLKNCYNASYEKTVEIPSNWKDKRLILSLDRVCSLAEVFVDDKKIGSIKWPYGSLDITDAVQAGKNINLRIAVQARPRNESIEDFTYYTPTKQAGEIYNRGLAGTVLLTAREKGPSLDGVFIKTSLLRKCIDLDLEVDNKAFSGSADFSFVIRDFKTGETVKTFEFQRDISASENISVQKFSLPWENPKLWDIDQPNLYTLESILKTELGKDALKERFGFREIRFDGRTVLLNEKPIRFRTYMEEFRLGGSEEVLKHAIKVKKAAGFNLAEICMNPRFEQYGSIGFRSEHADNCDEEGFALMMPTVDFDKLGYAQAVSRQIAEEWTQDFIKDWKRFRNHPSILMWVVGFNRFDTNIQRSPLYIGNRERLLGINGEWNDIIQSGNKIIATMNEIDPTRPASSHSGSGVGNFHTSNIYLNFIPLQEREAWLSEYAKNGNRPYCAVEFGTPLSYSFMRGRSGKVSLSEPMFTEWTAVYLGGRAFTDESDEYRSSLASIRQSYKSYATWDLIDTAKIPLSSELINLFVKNTWRSWRTAGVDLGMIPWGEAHGWVYPPSTSMHKIDTDRNQGRTPVVKEIQERRYNDYAAEYANETGRTLIANNQPCLAYIAGQKSDYTGKEHQFFSSSQVEKQIAVINDLRKNAEYDFTLSMKIEGKNITNSSFAPSYRFKGIAETGKTAMIPFTFSVPATKKISSGQLVMQGQIDGHKFSDEFEFTVFPEPANSGSVMLYDLSGKSAEYCRQLGFDVVSLKKIPEKTDKLLIIGENNMHMPDFPWTELELFVLNGGKLLLMTDKSELFTKRFGFRTAPHVSRRVFPISSLRNESLGKISPDMMRDWNGSGNIVPAVYGLEGDAYITKSHPYGFHWGNLGSVSSVPLEKPHASGWTPLMENEFALAYSPLMELRLGKGLIRLTSFDFVSRTARDPGAEFLFSTIVSDLATAKISPEHKTFLIGATEKEIELLSKMTLLFTVTETLPQAKDSLLIAGSKYNIDNQDFREFIAAGGLSLVLPRQPGDSLPGFSVSKETVGKNKDIPDWKLLRGISESDLFLKTNYSANVLSSSSAKNQTAANGLLGRYTDGHGEAIFIQLLPYMLNAKEIDYLKFPEWRWTRTLAQILSNCGAVFKVDQNFLSTDLAACVPSKITLSTGWKAEFERKEPKVANIAERLKDTENSGEKNEWQMPNNKLKNWKNIGVGNSYQSQGSYFSGCNGVLWYCMDIMIPQEWKDREIFLKLGVVDDMDVTYFNGHEIGRTDSSVPKYWSLCRNYKIKPEFIKFGEKNRIAVRCFDDWANGGIMDIPLLISDSGSSETYYLYCDNFDDGIDGDDVYRYYNW